MKLDFGLTASDYAKHRAGFPDSLFERLRAFGIGIAGQDVVDLGTGTGALARGFARRGCRVTGIDPSESMLAAARQLRPRCPVYPRGLARPHPRQRRRRRLAVAGTSGGLRPRARRAARIALPRRGVGGAASSLCGDCPGAAEELKQAQAFRNRSPAVLPPLLSKEGVGGR